MTVYSRMKKKLKRLLMKRNIKASMTYINFRRTISILNNNTVRIMLHYGWIIKFNVFFSQHETSSAVFSVPIKSHS